MSFTDELWTTAEPVFEKILDHPFVVELTAGELDRDRFAFYLVEDVQYIDEFVRILGLVGSRAPRRADVAMLTRRAGEVAAEHELHASLQADLGITDGQLAEATPGPTCRAYLDYLWATAHTAPFLEALCATLACPWIYWEVGRALIDRGSPDPLYQRWIERYGGDVAAVTVPPLLELADRVAASAPEAARGRGRQRFLTGCRYEWMFWDAGYHRRRWPV